MRYDDATRDAGLLALIMCGSPDRAAAELAADGKRISSRTLRRWRHDHPERYEQLRREVAPQVMEQVADDSAALLRRLVRAENAALDRLEDELPEMKGSDAARALQQIGISKGINVEKTLLIRGQPTQIVDDGRDLDAILNSLAVRYRLVDPSDGQQALPSGE